MPMKVRSAAVISTAEVTGEIRCGRTCVVISTWVTMKTASKMAIAGSVRRISRPMVTPRTKAKAA
jgi:L-arabinose isomerase